MKKTILLGTFLFFLLITSVFAVPVVDSAVRVALNSSYNVSGGILIHVIIGENSTAMEVLSSLRFNESDFKLDYVSQSNKAFTALINSRSLFELEKNGDIISLELPIRTMITDSQSSRIIQSDIVNNQLQFKGQGMVICIIDSGVNSSHPDFQNKILDEACFCNFNSSACCQNNASRHGLNSAQDDNGHGSHVAGIRRIILRL